MKQFFIIAAKLLGILLIFWTFSAFLGHSQVLNHMSRAHLIGLILLCGIELMIALILLFQTNMVANFLNIPEGELPTLHVPNVLHVGITLIGIMIAGSSLGYVLSYIATILFTSQNHSHSFFLGELFKTIVGVGLIIFAKQITKQIQVIQSSSDKPLPKPYVIDEN